MTWKVLSEIDFDPQDLESRQDKKEADVTVLILFIVIEFREIEENFLKIHLKLKASPSSGESRRSYLRMSKYLSNKVKLLRDMTKEGDPRPSYTDRHLDPGHSLWIESQVTGIYYEGYKNFQEN